MQTLALVAHNEKKDQLLEWATTHQDKLREYKLIGTGSTANMLGDSLGLEITSYGHGPYGGDVLLAAGVIKGEIEGIIFFLDPDSSHSHEHDILTLIRTAVRCNIPFALNQASAELLFSETKNL